MVRQPVCSAPCSLPLRFNSIQIPREMWHMLMGGLLFGDMRAENLLVFENLQPPLNRLVGGCRKEIGREAGTAARIEINH